MSIKSRLASLAALSLLATALISGCSGSDDDDDDVIKIGALLPTSGALSSYGETSQAAIEDLVATLNKDVRVVELVMKDSRTDPPTALAQLRDMHEEGVKIVVGPYSSSEVAAVKQFADDNGIILLSPLSTATTLATPGDNIYRFTPDDAAEGAAAAALAYADNMRVIVAVSRDDPGNLGLQSSFKAAFEKLGGRVVPGVTYPANEMDFKDEVQKIAEAVVSNVMSGSAGPGRNVGVYLTAFNEVTSLLSAVVDNGGEGPNSVAWYGSDSVALSKDLVANAKASGFAFGAGYPNPILGLRDSEKGTWGPVSDRLAQKLNRTPDAFALAAYDAFNVAFQVMTKAGARDLAAREAELTSITNSVTGLTGPLRLNEAGDRAIASYDFWSVCLKNNQWTWYRSATYDPTAGAKKLTGGC